MIDKPASKFKWLAFLSILVLLGALAIAFRWYIRRERKKTREATKEFGDRIDDRDVSERLRILRLERVLGLERIRTGVSDPSYVTGRGGGNGDRDGADRFEEGKKKRFRDLLLPSRRRQGSSGATDVEMDLRRTHTTAKTDRSNFAPNRIRESTYGAPPPPYAPSTPSDLDAASPWPLGDKKRSIPYFSSQPAEAAEDAHGNGTGRRDSLDSIPTPVLPSFTNWSPPPTHARAHSRTEKPKTIIHSMASSPSPTAITRPGGSGLMPPPRPGMTSRLNSYQDKDRPVHRSSSHGLLGNDRVDQGHGREEVREVDVDFERRLRELWPSMWVAREHDMDKDMEVEGTERKRVEEGWI
ncbi:hypothetical protein IAU59_006817 [Kwoniella sp. CBS 9459]